MLALCEATQSFAQSNSFFLTHYQRSFLKKHMPTGLFIHVNFLIKGQYQRGGFTLVLCY